MLSSDIPLLTDAPWDIFSASLNFLLILIREDLSWTVCEFSCRISHTVAWLVLWLQVVHDSERDFNRQSNVQHILELLYRCSRIIQSQIIYCSSSLLRSGLSRSCYKISAATPHECKSLLVLLPFDDHFIFPSLWLAFLFILYPVDSRRHNSDYCDSMNFMIGSRSETARFPHFPIYTLSLVRDQSRHRRRFSAVVISSLFSFSDSY